MKTQQHTNYISKSWNAFAWYLRFSFLKMVPALGRFILEKETFSSGQTYGLAVSLHPLSVYLLRSCAVILIKALYQPAPQAVSQPHLSLPDRLLNMDAFQRLKVTIRPQNLSAFAPGSCTMFYI